MFKLVGEIEVALMWHHFPAKFWQSQLTPPSLRTNLQA